MDEAEKRIVVHVTACMEKVFVVTFEVEENEKAVEAKEGTKYIYQMSCHICPITQDASDE